MLSVSISCGSYVKYIVMFYMQIENIIYEKNKM